MSDFTDRADTSACCAGLAPEDDPPMTVRVESRERRFDPTARRAIRSDDRDRVAWLLVTGTSRISRWITHDDVRDWHVSHPLEYTVAFRHASSARERTAEHRAGQLAERGDMDVTAFRTDSGTAPRAPD